MKSTKKTYIIIFEIIIILILILSLIFLYKNNPEEKNVPEVSTPSTSITEPETDTQETPDETDELVEEPAPIVPYEDPYEILSENENESIFVSMYPLYNYHSEDIKEILGIDTTMVNAPAATLEDLSDFLNAGISHNPDLTNIFLGLDLYTTCDSSLSDFDRYIFSFIDNNPDIKFWIYPACPSIDYQLDFYSEADPETVISWQKNICSRLISYDNVFLSHIYTEKWLTANRLNYESDKVSLTDTATTNMMWNSFLSQLTANNIDDVFAEFSERTIQYQYSRPQYADMSDTYCMFICDSLIALNTTNASIPNVISALSGATCIPVSIGGTTAAFRTDDFPHLAEMTSSIINNRPLDYEIASVFNANLQETDQAVLSSLDSKHFYIIIDMCINDYSLGTPVGELSTDIRTYRGGLVTSVRMLKKAYPNATVVLMSPYHIPGHNNGTDSFVETGEALADYVNIMKEVAAKEGAEFIDIYNAFNADGSLGLTYLISDLVHPSNLGCFELGEYIVEQLGLFSTR